MLWRAEHCSLMAERRRGRKVFLTFQVGRLEHSLGVLSIEDFARTEQAQLSMPILVARVGQHNYWRFKNLFFVDNENLYAWQIFELLGDDSLHDLSTMYAITTDGRHLTRVHDEESGNPPSGLEQRSS